MNIRSPYSILQANLVSSSTTGEAFSVDIKNSILEIQFFENLYKSYIDAKLVFLDDAGLKNYLSMQGVERINIRIGDPDKPTEQVIDKTFFISRIMDSYRIVPTTTLKFFRSSWSKSMCMSTQLSRSVARLLRPSRIWSPT